MKSSGSWRKRKRPATDSCVSRQAHVKASIIPCCLSACGCIVTCSKFCHASAMFASLVAISIRMHYQISRMLLSQVTASGGVALFGLGPARQTPSNCQGLNQAHRLTFSEAAAGLPLASWVQHLSSSSSFRQRCSLHTAASAVPAMHRPRPELPGPVVYQRQAFHHQQRCGAHALHGPMWPQLRHRGPGVKRAPQPARLRPAPCQQQRRQMSVVASDALPRCCPISLAVSALAQRALTACSYRTQCHRLLRALV